MIGKQGLGGLGADIGFPGSSGVQEYTPSPANQSRKR